MLALRKSKNITTSPDGVQCPQMNILDDSEKVKMECNPSIQRGEVSKYWLHDCQQLYPNMVRSFTTNYS